MKPLGKQKVTINTHTDGRYTGQRSEELETFSNDNGFVFIKTEKGDRYLTLSKDGLTYEESLTEKEDGDG